MYLSLKSFFRLFVLGLLLSLPSMSLAQTLPYSEPSVREHVVLDYGKRTIRTDADQSISLGTLDKHNCFIVMSKKDYYLYVYEKRSSDTVLVARYDCCFALRKGNKTKQGDMRTPHCTSAVPFSRFRRYATPLPGGTISVTVAATSFPMVHGFCVWI